MFYVILIARVLFIWTHTHTHTRSHTQTYTNYVLYGIRSRSMRQWRHTERDGASNHRPLHCLLNRLFRRRSKKHQSSTSLAFVRGIQGGPENSPHKGPVTRKVFPFDDVIMVNGAIPKRCRYIWGRPKSYNWSSMVSDMHSELHTQMLSTQDYPSTIIIWIHSFIVPWKMWQ